MFCAECGQIININAAVSFGDSTFHATCFNCSKCKKSLADTGNKNASIIIIESQLFNRFHLISSHLISSLRCIQNETGFKEVNGLPTCPSCAGIIHYLGLIFRSFILMRSFIIFIYIYISNVWKQEVLLPVDFALVVDKS